MSEKSKAFFNRYGRIMRDAPLQKDVSASGKTTLKARRTTSNWTPLAKKPRLILVALIVLTIAGLWLGYGAIVSANYDKSTSEINSRVKTLASGDVKTLQASKTLDENLLTQINSELADIAKTNCPQLVLKSITAPYPNLKTKQSSCLATKENAEQLKSSFKAFSESIIYNQKLASLLAPALAPPKDAFAVLATQANLWSSSAKELVELRPPQQLVENHEQILKSVQTTASTWKDLVDADAGENAGAFSAAETNLSKQYTQVRSLAAGLQNALTTQQKTLSEVYAKFSS